tara:strand:+ start:56 stop:418 length:363 start_codon:yes stop_codon:yes gene_type:complete
MPVSITEKVSVGSIKKVTATWTSDGSGAATGTTTAVLDGNLIGLTTIPAGGEDAPTDNYDVTVTDSDGHDVLLGAGADRDTANTEHVTEGSLAAVSHSPLTFTIANAGDTKQGTVILYIR